METSRYNPLALYGLRIDGDHLLMGYVKPRLYGQTPVFSYAETPEPLLLPYQDQLRYIASYTGFGAAAVQQSLQVTSVVFQAITGRSMDDYGRFIYMPNNDFKYIEDLVKKRNPLLRSLDGVNIQGRIINRRISDKRIFQLNFHELGHSLYPPTDSYSDEVRAYYFQLLCSRKLEEEAHKLNIDLCLLESFSSDNDFASDAHARAFRTAQHLYWMQRIYDGVVKNQPEKEALLRSLLDLIKQPSIHIPQIDVQW